MRPTINRLLPHSPVQSACRVACGFPGRTVFERIELRKLGVRTPIGVRKSATVGEHVKGSNGCAARGCSKGSSSARLLCSQRILHLPRFRYRYIYRPPPCVRLYQISISLGGAMSAGIEIRHRILSNGVAYQLQSRQHKKTTKEKLIELC